MITWAGAGTFGFSRYFFMPSFWLLEKRVFSRIDFLQFFSRENDFVFAKRILIWGADRSLSQSPVVLMHVCQSILQPIIFILWGLKFLLLVHQKYSWKMKFTLKIAGLQQNVLGELLQIQRTPRRVLLVCVRNLDLFLAVGCHCLFYQCENIS